jgi:hypothetical protein
LFEKCGCFSSDYLWYFSAKVLVAATLQTSLYEDLEYAYVIFAIFVSLSGKCGVVRWNRSHGFSFLSILTNSMNKLIFAQLFIEPSPLPLYLPL